MSINNTLIIPMPDAVRILWEAQQGLVKHYLSTGLQFTLDGRLLGDIGEALALQRFDLNRPKKRTPGVDVVRRDGRTVQIKATGNLQSGPAFTPGKGRADYLLFFRLDFPNNAAMLTYNGPEDPVRKRLPKGDWRGTFAIPLDEILALDAQVNETDRILPKEQVITYLVR